MFNTHSTRADFSEAATQYDANALLQHNVRLKLLETARAVMPAQGRVLDAGCGTGRLIHDLSLRGGNADAAIHKIGNDRKNGLLPPQQVRGRDDEQNYDIVALDLAQGMCEQAAFSNTQVVCAPVGQLPFADASFDVVFSSLVLQWVDDFAGALEEMRRVLKPSGVLAVSYLSKGTLNELQESFAVCDAYPHISEFPDALPEAESEVITEYYSDTHALMQHLKTIGARNKLDGRRKSLMTPKQFERIETYYRAHFANSAGIYASWHVQYLVEVRA